MMAVVAAITLVAAGSILVLSYLYTISISSSIAIFGCLYVIYKLLFQVAPLSPLHKLPEPPGALPLVGHDLALFQNPPGQHFSRWIREIPNDGLIRFRGFLGSERLLVTNPEAIAEVLVAKSYDFEKPFRLRTLLQRFFGNGLILVEGDEHKALRKGCLPAFTFRRVRNFYPIFWSKALCLTECIEQEMREKSTEVVEVNYWAVLAAMDIIGMAAVGKDLRTMETHGDHALVTYFEELTRPSAQKILYFAFNVLGFADLVKLLPWKMNTLASSISTNLHDACRTLLRERREEISKHGLDADREDILFHLIRSTTLSEEQLTEQLLTFFAAGHGTTAVTITWLTYLLAKDPEVQTSLRVEIRKAIPDLRAHRTADEMASILQSLPLLNGVCNETLRLFPAINTSYRTATRTTQVLGTPIPQGTQIVLSPWIINRDPKLWSDNAEDFFPDRWIEVDAKTGERRPNNSGGARSVYANLTFLHGPRSCIGHAFATAELRCLAAAFVARFEFEMADPNEVVIPYGNLGAKPKNGMHLRLRCIA